MYDLFSWEVYWRQYILTEIKWVEWVPYVCGLSSGDAFGNLREGTASDSEVNHEIGNLTKMYYVKYQGLEVTSHNLSRFVLIVWSLITLSKGEFKMSIDGCIRKQSHLCTNEHIFPRILTY